MAQEWFYVQNGQQQGPVSFESLQAMAANDQLPADTLVWMQTMAEWQEAASVPALLPPPRLAPTPPAASGPPPLPQGGYIQQNVPYASQMSYQQSPAMGEDAGMRWVLPVGRSGWAIAAGYMGLLSMLFIFSPLAILFAILAFREMKRNPNKHGMGRAVFGLVMGIIFLVLGLGLLLVGSSRRF